MRKPWTKRLVEVVASKYGKALVREVWVKPNGAEEEYMMLQQRDWVVVLAVTKDGRVVVVNEFKPGRADFGDELPAGTSMNPEDAWSTTAARVLQNEAGFIALQFVNLGSQLMASRNSHTTATLVLALDCVPNGEPAAQEAAEIIWKLVPLTIWVARVLNGEITEWSATSVTMMALPYLGWQIAPPPQ